MTIKSLSKLSFHNDYFNCFHIMVIHRICILCCSSYAIICFFLYHSICHGTLYKSFCFFFFALYYLFISSLCIYIYFFHLTIWQYYIIRPEFLNCCFFTLLTYYFDNFSYFSFLSPHSVIYNNGLVNCLIKYNIKCWCLWFFSDVVPHLTFFVVRCLIPRFNHIVPSSD